MAAKEGTLGILHERIAQRMLALLDDPEAEIKAADLAVMVKFLKDNGINCDVEESEATKALAAKASATVLQFPFNPAREG
jgi:hypothetical protein